MLEVITTISAVRFAVAPRTCDHVSLRLMELKSHLIDLASIHEEARDTTTRFVTLLLCFDPFAITHVRLRGNDLRARMDQHLARREKCGLTGLCDI